MVLAVWEARTSGESRGCVPGVEFLEFRGRSLRRGSGLHFAWVGQVGGPADGRQIGDTGRAAGRVGRGLFCAAVVDSEVRVDVLAEIVGADVRGRHAPVRAVEVTVGETQHVQARGHRQRLPATESAAVGRAAHLEASLHPPGDISRELAIEPFQRNEVDRAHVASDGRLVENKMGPCDDAPRARWSIFSRTRKGCESSSFRPSKAYR